MSLQALIQALEITVDRLLSMSGQVPRKRASKKKRTTRTTQEEKEEAILEAEEDVRTGKKRKRAISTSGSLEVAQMAANAVSCNLDQTVLEEIVSQVRIFMEAAKVQAVEEGCSIRSVLSQLVNTLKGVQEREDESKALSGKLDAILAELSHS